MLETDEDDGDKPHVWELRARGYGDVVDMMQRYLPEFDAGPAEYLYNYNLKFCYRCRRLLQFQRPWTLDPILGFCYRQPDNSLDPTKNQSCPLCTETVRRQTHDVRRCAGLGCFMWLNQGYYEDLCRFCLEKRDAIESY